MNENNELINHVYDASQMGVSSTTKLLGMIKNKENKIKHVLESELKEYKKYLKLSEKYLLRSNITPEGNSIFTKISSDFGIMLETIMDNSDRALASMLIEGISMGVTQIESKINDYKKVCQRESLEIAKDFVNFSKNEIEKLKTFM